MADAVVIGAGPNGLVAAAMLADAGWDVVVVEAQETPGGACRSAEVTAPGFSTDLFSAFHPLGFASPHLRALDLAAHGLRWSHAPSVLAHPTADGRTAVLSRDVRATAASVSAWDAADGAAWTALAEQWQRLRDPLLGSLFGPFPPVRSAARLARRLGAAELLRLARMAVLPVRRLAAEEFRGEGAGLLLAGNAMHTDVAPDSAGSAVYGWLLAMLAQDVGFPAPVGGAGALSGALVARCAAAGVRFLLGARVDRVLLRGGRAVGVRVADGTEIEATRAVLADVDAPQLYLGLVGGEHLPVRLRADLARFDWDQATVKVDWALSAPIPWRQDGCAGAGTVHLGGETGSMDGLAVTAGELARGLLPTTPFVLLGQMTTTDAARSPAGTESAWGYAHAPRHPRGADAGITWRAGDVAAFADRIEATVEHWAPGFRDLVVGRHVQGPRELEANDGIPLGALNGGTAAIHQQLFFRPVPGLGRAETVVPGLYLAGMSAHPGGGVHGGPGANAAKAALRANGLLGPARTAMIGALHRQIYR